MAEFGTKKLKCKQGENHAEDGKDRISELPDEVLFFILSLLTITEGAKLSLLSRRWRMLWNQFIPRNLNLDGSKRLDAQFRKLFPPKACKAIITSETLKFVNWVNKVLKSYQQAPAGAIDELKIQFDLDGTYKQDIDSWVAFALGKKVKNLELAFIFRGWTRDVLYPFPPLNNNLNRLQLRSRTLGFPKCDSLTSLVLTRVNVTGEILERIIRSCPFLERLSLVYSLSLVHLNVVGPSLRLKCLEINYCEALKRLRLSATSLVSFKYFGRNMFMPSQINVPNLIELCIQLGNLRNFVYCNFPLPSAYISLIQKLILTVEVPFSRLKEVEDIQFPRFRHLKELELRVIGNDTASLLVFSSLINASPSLSELTLQFLWKINHQIEGRKAQKASKCPHSGLKVVKVVGFVGQTIDTEFCMYLIENAVMLEKIKIDTRNPTLSLFECFNRKIIRPNIPQTMINAARERAEQLKTEYGLEDKLVIL
ncbi:hypothetical protein DITRI_Ditri08aG0087400 [Diplodiscus trichospermus]